MWDRSAASCASALTFRRADSPFSLQLLRRSAAGTHGIRSRFSYCLFSRAMQRSSGCTIGTVWRTALVPHMTAHSASRSVSLPPPPTSLVVSIERDTHSAAESAMALVEEPCLPVHVPQCALGGLLEQCPPLPAASRPAPLAQLDMISTFVANVGQESPTPATAVAVDTRRWAERDETTNEDCAVQLQEEPLLPTSERTQAHESPRGLRRAGADEDTLRSPRPTDFTPSKKRFRWQWTAGFHRTRWWTLSALS